MLFTENPLSINNSIKWFKFLIIYKFIVFAELRCVVQQFFPGRQDIARLALSSFVIMRFFAAAILNPRLFALKRESPVN